MENNKVTPQARRRKTLIIVGTVLAIAVVGGLIAVGVVFGTKGSSSNTFPSTTSSSQAAIVPTPTEPAPAPGTATESVSATSIATATEPASASASVSVSVSVSATPTPGRPCGPFAVANCKTPTCTNNVGGCLVCNPGYALDTAGSCTATAALKCPVVAADSVCVASLEDAVAKAGDGSIITVYQSGLVITREIEFSKSLTIQGDPDSATRIDLVATLQSGVSILRATGAEQSVTLRHIAFAKVGGAQASAFRTLDLGFAAQPTEPTQFTSLSIIDCSFSNFETSTLRGGSAVFVGQSRALLIDNSVFENNIVNNYVADDQQVLMWSGGGAVWIHQSLGHVRITNNVFHSNQFYYPHSLGGGLMVGRQLGYTIQVLKNTFTNNIASAGAAFHLFRLAKEGKLFIDSTFKNNEAREFGWNSRGGAVWLEQIEGRAEIRGSFIGNTAQGGRGGALANNIISGSVFIEAEFTGNQCADSGSLWDSWSSVDPFKGTGKVVLSGESIVAGNTGTSLVSFQTSGAVAVSVQQASFTPGTDIVFSNAGAVFQP